MEDLKWLSNEKYKKYSYIVYNKGSDSNYYKSDKFLREIRLPNVGRESHTYLYHIIHNYNHLNEMTIFLPGSMELPHKTRKGIALLDQLVETPSTSIFVCDKELKTRQVLHEHMFLTLNYANSSNKMNINNNQGSKLQPSYFRPFGFWYMFHFDKNLSNTYTTYNSIFALSRELIQSKTVDYYNILIRELDHHHNPEVGHYFERAWYAVFYDSNIETTQVYVSLTF
jgi:Protein of unknown function (DUF3431)